MPPPRALSTRCHPSSHDAGARRLSPDARVVQELSYSDPAFCLSYLAHSQLFVNNLARNGSVAQVACFRPGDCGRGVCGGASAAHVELARHSPHGSCVPPIVASTHSHATHETVAVGTVAAARVLGRAHRWHGNERAELRHGRACDAHHRATAGRSGRGRHAHVPGAPRLGACRRGQCTPLAGRTNRATPPPTTQARAQPDGSFKLNGTKMWITNGAVNDTDTGDVFLVCARRLRRRPRDAGRLPRSAAAWREARVTHAPRPRHGIARIALCWPSARVPSPMHPHAAQCTPSQCIPSPRRPERPHRCRYARTGGPDVRPSQAVSLFVVERGMPGFSLGQRLKDK